jgi:hypothetical protein
VSSAVLGLEGVADVLEEDQTKNDVLVLGRIHVVAERVGGAMRCAMQVGVAICRW